MSVMDRLKWLVFRRPKLKKIDCWAHWTAYLDSATQLAGNNRIGKDSNINASSFGRHTYVVNARIIRAEIGMFCSIGPEVNIGGLGSHPTNYISTHPIFYSPLCQSGKSFATNSDFEELKSVHIGNDVWIGARALILDGVHIGDGAIIAAGAVVAKDVPPYAIVGGVPAKVIRYRFSEDVIHALLNWQWWSLTDEVLKKFANEFCRHEQWTCSDIERLRAVVAQFVTSSTDSA